MLLPYAKRCDMHHTGIILVILVTSNVVMNIRYRITKKANSSPSKQSPITAMNLFAGIGARSASAGYGDGGYGGGGGGGGGGTE